MEPLVTILTGYVLDIRGNALWDLTKAIWSKLTGRSWENLFVDAFEAAIKDEAPRLTRYGDGSVSLSREDLHRVLHQQLAIPVSTTSPTELTNEQFAQSLATALVNQKALIIGGHNLSEADYASLISNVVRKALAIFKTTIVNDPDAFNQALIRESLRLNVSATEMREYLEEHFNIIMPEIQAISTRTQVLLGMSEHVSQDVRSMRDEMRVEFSEMKKLFQTGRVIIDDESEIEKRIEERVLNQRIDAAIQLLQEGKVITAKARLEEIANQLEGKEVEPQVKFRVFSNLGACHLNLGNHHRAVEYLENAYSIAPNETKALANFSVAALLRDDFELAFELANQCLVIHPEQPTALSVLLEASFRLQRMDELDEAVIEEAEKHVDSRRTLANMLAEKGELERAEQLHRSNVNSPKAEPQDLVLLAQVLMTKVRNERLDKVPVPWIVDLSPSKEQFEEAEGLVNHVIELWRHSENRDRYHNTLILRASIRGMQGQDELALEDCRVVLVENPNHEDALRNAGLAAFQMGDTQTAIQFLKKIASSSTNTDMIHLVLAASYIKQESYQDAVEFLANVDPKMSLESRVDNLRLLAEAAHSLGKRERVAEVIGQLLDLDGDSPSILEAIGSLMQMVGRVDEAESYLNQAYELSAGGKQIFFAFRLGEFYFLQRRFSKAVQFYERAEVPLTDTPTTQKYLISLLNSGNWNQAFQLAQKIRNNGPAIPVITEVEARITEYVDDLNSARELYCQLIAADPDNPEHYVRAAYIDLRLGHLSNAIRVLERVISRFEDNAIILMSAAQILADAEYSMNEVIEIAYKARRIGMDDPQVQSAYINIFLRTEKDNGLFEPQAVTMDTAVQLDSDGQSRWFVILDDQTVDKAKGELHPNDPLAKRLIGSKEGDTIELGQHPVRTIFGTVKKIQSKYVRAFQDTITNFNTDFPDALGPISIPFPLNDPNQIVSLPMFRQDSTQTVLDCYIKKGSPLPLGSVAELTGRSIVEVWEHLTNISDGTIRAATGHSREQSIQAEIAATNNSLSLELTALLTLRLLGHLDNLKKRFEKIYVAQSLIDQLTETIRRDQQLGNDGAKFLQIHEGMLRFSEIPAEQVQKRVSELEGLKRFVENNCEIIPIKLAIELGQTGFEKFESLTGRQQIDSILVAKQTESILYSDDLWLRILANNEFLVQGVWSQAIVGELVQSGLIKHNDFFEATIRLILANYHYVAVDKETLVYTLEHNQWHISHEVQKVFARLGGPDTTASSAIVVLSNFTKEIWLGPLLFERKIALLDLSLHTLVKNRPVEPALLRFRDALLNAFVLAPLHQHEVKKQIDIWVNAYSRINRVM